MNASGPGGDAASARSLFRALTGRPGVTRMVGTTAGGTGRAGKPKKEEERDEGAWSAERQEAFLAELARTANVRASARAVNMSEAGIYRLRLRSARFRAAWARALREGYARLELMMIERAMKGTPTRSPRAGEKARSAREYPDRLAMFLLTAHRAAVEAEREAPQADPRAVCRKLETRLAEMNRRMGGNG